MKHEPTVVIGAGPYGLSVAAHLKARNIPTLVFGKTMEFWKGMPAGLCLKSVWSASSLSDPAGNYDLDHYLAATGTPRQEPIPVSLFLNYTQWFQKQVVPDVDPTFVQKISRDGKYFHLEMADGRELKARRVIVAAGISLFTKVPDYARDLPATVASHTQFQPGYEKFRGRKVIMVGSGQSALEYSALLHEAGAEVEVVSRGPIRWHNHTLYFTGPVRHIFYPPGDVGPPGINWLVAFPELFRHFPENFKNPMHKRAIRPGGAHWLRPRLEGKVKFTPETHVLKAQEKDGGVRLELSDGTTREADFLYLGTGYRPDMTKLPFLDPTLKQQVENHDGYPLLDTGFESVVPGLHFVGALAGHTYGPTCRFVSGAKAPARQIAHHAAE